MSTLQSCLYKSIPFYKNDLESQSYQMSLECLLLLKMLKLYYAVVLLINQQMVKFKFVGEKCV